MTRLTLPGDITADPRALAAALAEHQAPGRRSMTRIRKLRRERRTRQAAPPPPQPLADRARARAAQLYRAEITARGGETVIEGRYGGALLAITDRDDARRLVVMHTEGYRDYGSREGCHWARLSYLCGFDDSGRWAARVPGTIATIPAALDWLTPAEVTRAQQAGRAVLRQGDLYAIQARRDTPTGWVGDGQSHWWDADARLLTHRPADGRTHAPLPVPWPARFAQQRTYQMGRPRRTAAWGPGD